VAKRGLTSLDLLVVARDLRSQWFAFAFARLSAPVARLGASRPAAAPNAGSTGKLRVFPTLRVILRSGGGRS
jgi:hypothetical protein